MDLGIQQCCQILNAPPGLVVEIELSEFTIDRYLRFAAHLTIKL